MPPYKDLKGQKFGTLLVLTRLTTPANSNARYFCYCDCGNYKETYGVDLESGKTRICGNGCVLKHNLIGKIFGKLTVLDEVEKENGKQEKFWLCQCDCENQSIVKVSTGKLKNGNTKSCGCLKRNSVDLLGKKFGKLLVIAKTELRSGNKSIFYKCLCECGNEKLVQGCDLGRVKTCGKCSKRSAHLAVD